MKNKHRLTKGILIASLALGLTASATVAAFQSQTAEAVTNKITFKDVPKTYWAYDEIGLAVEKGLVVGYNGNFNPRGNVTRAAFSQMLAQALEGTERVQNAFTDVSKSHWAADAINEGIALGFIDPGEYKNNRFEPAKAMTRVEVAKWLSKGLVSVNAEYGSALAEMASATTPFLPISDLNEVKSSDIPYVGIVMGTELMIGKTSDTFNPNASITRAEVAAILPRYLEKMDKNPSEFSKLNEFRNIDNSGDFTIIDIE